MPFKVKKVLAYIFILIVSYFKIDFKLTKHVSSCSAVAIDIESCLIIYHYAIGLCHATKQTHLFVNMTFLSFLIK